MLGLWCGCGRKSRDRYPLLTSAQGYTLENISLDLSDNGLNNEDSSDGNEMLSEDMLNGSSHFKRQTSQWKFNMQLVEDIIEKFQI